ncbi:hypothetical protein [Serratia marcescens]|uniref:hypothetical protein n=1 Tax=Serratia marcescens TaxID=615 RepID=UPI0009F4FB0C|nr:hypothetical protein [Serratia marcescens]OQV32008.1 hypothetical protein BV901_19535 [Serratia nematodiphila]WGL76562.1 hypothetical protein QFB82_19155 [Serratia marcescens]
MTTKDSNKQCLPSWSFTNLANTYRFWALLATTVFAALGLTLCRQYLFWSDPPSPFLSGFSDMAWGKGSLFGIPLGLLLARCKTLSGMLAVLTICIALNAGLLFSDGKDQFRAFVGWINQTIMISLCLAIPALLAGWAKDRIAVAGAMAIIISCQFFNEILSAIHIIFTDLLGITPFHLGAAGLIALITSILISLPVGNRKLESIPHSYYTPLPPKRRHAALAVLVTALPWLATCVILSLLAFGDSLSLEWRRIWLLVAFAVFLIGLVFIAYWFYRIHGEAASLMPSTEFITPKAALWIYLLVPLSMQVLLLNLSTILPSPGEGSPAASRWLKASYMACVILFPPAAIGIVQSRLNREIESSPDIYCRQHG